MKNKALTIVLKLGAASAVFVSACSAPPPTIPASNGTALVPTVTLAAASVSPLQSPLIPTATVPAPDKDKGTVTAVLYNQYLSQPYADRYIYLGHVSEMQSASGGTPIPFVELDIQADPFGHTDENGRLIISNVAPGKYALILLAPNLTQAPIVDPATGSNISVEIQPDKISDLGTVTVSFPE